MRTSSNTRASVIEEALQALPEAVAVFDQKGRLVAWNACFSERHSEGLALQIGVRLADHLGRVLALELAPAAKGQEAHWLAERVARFARGTRVAEHRDGFGRSVRVECRTLPSGGWVCTERDITESARREQSSRVLFEANPTPMIIVDRETLGLLSVNDAAVEFYGYPRETMLGLKLTDIRPEAVPGEIPKAISRMGKGFVRGMPAVHLTASGERRPVKINGRIVDYDGRPALLAAVLDMTEQHRLEAEVSQSKSFLRQVIDEVPCAVFVKDMEDDGRYVVYNRTTEAMFRIQPGAALGRSVGELFSADYAAKLMAEDTLVLKSGSFDTIEDDVLQQEDGSQRRFRTRKAALAPSPGAAPRFIVGVVEDVTEQRASAARIAHMAHHDLLTDLPNRVLFGERLEAALARLRTDGGCFALLYLDLDGFKAVNDAWGHAVGDALLQAVAGRISHRLRDGDTAARVGGDEFLLLQTTLQRPRDAEKLAKRLVESLSEPFTLAGHVLRVGVSIGIALAPAHGLDAEVLLARADAALYRAKREGRRTFRIAA